MARCCLWMIPVVVCIWSWPSTNLFVTAQTPIPTVNLFPESANMSEGDTMTLICTVNSNYFKGGDSSVAIEWVRKTPNTTLTLARNGTGFDPRCSIQEVESELAKYEELSIVSLRKEDAGIYSCTGFDLKTGATLGSADLLISVGYFPATIDCSPDGPLTVEEGSAIRMSCTTEIGDPPSTFTISDRFGISDEWTLSQNATRQTLSLVRTITPTDRGYVCTISQPTGVFTGMERSCLIGPFIVIPTRPTSKSLKTSKLFPHVPMTSTPTTPLTTYMYPSNLPYTISPIPWVTISIISLALSTVSFAINIFIVVHLQRSNKQAGPAVNRLDEVKSYTELQPRYNTNKNYTELISRSIKEENESAEYEYPKLERENTYDDVQLQLAAHRRYQNI